MCALPIQSSEANPKACPRFMIGTPPRRGRRSVLEKGVSVTGYARGDGKDRSYSSDLRRISQPLFYRRRPSAFQTVRPRIRNRFDLSPTIQPRHANRELATKWDELKQ